MKIETPAVQADPNVELFYVSSESNPDDKGKQYIVVHHKNHDQFYCDCRDFIVRHLPKVLSGETSHCKHGDFVKDISSFAGSKYRLVSADDLQGTAIFEVRAEVNPDGAKNLPDWLNLCALAQELGQPIHFFGHASNAIDAIERKED